MDERWGALPLGELHPEDQCAFCGYRYGLKRTVLALTQAPAMTCSNPIVCERRRARAKREVV